MDARTIAAMLSDPDVKAELVDALHLEQEVPRLLSDPAVKADLIEALDLEREVPRLLSSKPVMDVLMEDMSSRIRTDPQMKQALESMLSDPALQQALLGSLDMGALLKDPEISAQLKSAVNLEPALLLPELRTRLANDETANQATLVIGWPLLLLFVAIAHAMLVTEVALTASMFGLYLVGFVDSTTFQFVWLFLPHVARAALGVMLARRVPTIHSLLRAFSAATSAAAPSPSPDVAEEAAPVVAVPPELAAPLMGLIAPLSISWALCLLFDLIALILCFVWSHLTRKIDMNEKLSDQLFLEQVALAVLIPTTLSFLSIDLAPLTSWPLLRWALPPSYGAAVSAAVSSAVASVCGGGAAGAHAEETDGGPARGKSEPGGGVDGGPTEAQLQKKRESIRRSLLHKAPPPPPPPRNVEVANRI